MLKTTILAVLFLTILALGGLLLQAKQTAKQQAAQIAGLQAQIANQHAEIQKTTATAADLAQKHSQLAARLKAAKQSLADARDAAASNAPVSVAPAGPSPVPTPTDATGGKKKPSNPFSDSIAKMMKDPAMKGMMRTTQGSALKQMYGDLVKQWALSPEETNTFYDLLLDKQMAGMDRGMKLLENGSDTAGSGAASDPDAQIKASLGDDLYKQYQDYEKTIGGRFAVNQFQQQLAVSNTPTLTPDQSKYLLQAITEEQANMAPGSFAPSSSAGGNPYAMDAAQVDRYMKAQAELNDKVDTRMVSLLTTEQLRVFKEQQQQLLAAQRMGMEMAAKLMAPAPTP